MNKHIKIFFIIVFSVFLGILPSFSIGSDVVTNQKDTKNLVTKINYDDVIKKAKEHSYDLKIADFQVLISKQEVRGARSEYFPKLAFNAGTEYTKNYRDTRDTQVMAIGDSFVNPYTRYQSIMGIVLSYNLFDFGVRKGHLDISKEDVLLKKLEESQKLQELNLNVIDTYSKILVAKKQIDLNKEILAIEEKNLEMKSRLYKAKEISKTELNSATARVSTIKKRIAELKSIMSESVNMLSFYTGEEYDIENLKIDDIKKPNFDTNSFNDYTKTIVWKIHEKQIKKKELELKVAKRNNYPKLNAYSRYYMYGSDKSSYPDSLSDFGPSNYTIGASLYMPVFDGMKNNSLIKKTSLELQQLQVERDKGIAQYMTRLATMRTNLIYLNEQIQENDKISKELQDKEKSMHKLASKRLISPIEENNTKTEVLENKIELEKNMTTSIAIIKAIQILTEENENK